MREAYSRSSSCFLATSNELVEWQESSSEGRIYYDSVTLLADTPSVTVQLQIVNSKCEPWQYVVFLFGSQGSRFRTEDVQAFDRAHPGHRYLGVRWLPTSRLAEKDVGYRTAVAAIIDCDGALV